MKIVRKEKYSTSLKQILSYISKDSKIQAINFKNELDENINKIISMPYKYRKSIYFNDENIRDLIYKGYVIPYKIDKEKNQIIIIGVNKYKANL
ncbi:MAG: type II toxin-antitoxin system RelE/ParE family toxin [Campylobacterota bacterium]|nr:type II toxin-antitoxin system RelE/ParE family toxin [Campylobacterota bacterium]